jgi:micrococcal nuclease
MRIIRPLISLAILALVIFLLYQYVLWPFFFLNRAKIVHMIDADSYMVMQNGQLSKIQLIGADAPETTFLDGKKVRQCFGGEAKDLAANLFFKENRDVTLESDSAAGEKDIHGRELKYVYLEDGRMLNEELIKEGLARVYFDEDHVYSRHDSFETLQETAKNEDKGLWEVCGK